MGLLDMTRKQIAAEYRSAYQQHQAVVESYTNGNCSSSVLRSSASQLKQLRAAYKIVGEAV